MWRRAYLLLIIVRLYFTLSPSYIHPDENFQGPEAIAGKIFSFPHQSTWEFTSEKPIRSYFALWPVYGLPMVLLQWVWTDTGKDGVAPWLIYYTLRVLMFVLSFVLEDWALHELIPSRARRRLAITLVASSYVTWTYQTHTFSNSIETLVVLWSLVMVERIRRNKKRSSITSSALLGIFITFGIFNRITFPAFLFAPCLYLLPHFRRKPLSLLTLALTILLTTLLAIAFDTALYTSNRLTLSHLRSQPILTPLNSLLYNTSLTSLSTHGLHPIYQHTLINLPLLLLPALPLLLTIRHLTLPFLSSLTSTLLLSLLPHQEPRFLLPSIPLLLTSIHLPKSPTLTRIFITTWIIFNAFMGILMGIYHQGGIVPAQLWLSQSAPQPLADQRPWHPTEILWWRTYPPPVYLLDGANITTTDLMGVSYPSLLSTLEAKVPQECEGEGIGLVAPWSSMELDEWRDGEEGKWVVEEMWRYGPHLNLDDVDIGGEGLWRTLRRVVGRRGLVVWRVGRRCIVGERVGGLGDW